jgi:predicted PurR-regulated permease PerM
VLVIAWAPDFRSDSVEIHEFRAFQSRNTVAGACESAMRPAASGDVTRVLLSVLAIGALLVGTVWTLLPFLSAMLWAATIAIATWPALVSVERLAGGRRGVAVAIMTLLVLVAFIAPFAVAIGTLVDAAGSSPAVMRDFLASGIGPPPPWIAGIPLVGDELAGRWQAVAAGGPEAIRDLVLPHAGSVAGAALAATGGVGRVVVLVLLTVVLVGILYAHGETAADGVRAFARRLGGDTGEHAVTLAGQAIRGVALGVVVTALVQSLLAGTGLWLSGIPHPGVLTAIAFVLGVAQIGPLPVMALAAVWLYWTGNTGWAVGLVLWSVPLVTLDNVLRPVLIRRGVQLPLLLIVAGVIGGLIGFGVVGLFIGPVVLAVTYTLTKAWIAMGETGPA